MVKINLREDDLMKIIDIGLSGNQHVNKTRKDPMYGAIAGDIIGSRFEFNNHRSKDFELFTEDCEFTDDTVMTLAVYKATKDYYFLKDPCLSYEDLLISNMTSLGHKYPNCSYGLNFSSWLDDPKPYYSCGNGAPMRMSGVFVYGSKDNAVTSSIVSHNHPEAIKAVKILYELIELAYKGKDIHNLVKLIPYDLDFTLDDIRYSYEFDETCQGTMPVAIKAFLESTSFEDAIRNAISVGGDSDTIACIVGSIAGAYYGVPTNIKKKVESYLDNTLLNILKY